MGKATCYFCSKKCRGDVLKVEDKYFHKECFTCKVCHQKLENVPFYFKENGFYCTHDYANYCASTCFFCEEKIIGEVVTALNHTFHKQCFKCSRCQRQFEPGDKVSMRNKEFLCSNCCYQTQLTETKEEKYKNNNIDTIHHNTPVVTLSVSPLHHNQSSLSTALAKESSVSVAASTSVPLRRKQPMTNGDIKSFSQPRRPASASKNSTDSMPNRVSNVNESFSTHRHFHIPPAGNSRSWIFSPNVVGSRNHPLALSTSHLEKSSVGMTPQHRAYEHSNNTEDRGYPTEKEAELVPLERDDFPAPPASHVVFADRNRRKIQNPTVEALSAGTTPKIRKARSSPNKPNPASTNVARMVSNTTEPNYTPEVLKQESEFGNSTFPPRSILTNQDRAVLGVPVNPISASRCPSASCEPLIPPRYDDHMETSPSRNDEYFRSPGRHLGYSMEFVNSTSRSFLGDSFTGSRQNLRHSFNPRMIHNDVSGLKKVRPVHSANGPTVRFFDSSAEEKESIYNSSTNIGDEMTIPYDKLRLPATRRVKNIDRTKLETYLTNEDFERVFRLSKSAFYRLPEWKRNDLKKKVDLF